MVLIIGGAFQNKQEYALDIYSNEESQIEICDLSIPTAEAKGALKNIIEKPKTMEAGTKRPITMQPNTKQRQLGQGEIEDNDSDNSIIPFLNVEFQELTSIKILDNIQAMIKDKMIANEYVKEMLDELINKYPDMIVICDEVGSGIVPMDKFDREYRDKVGEISCYLAKKATSVHRVVCGLGMVIKSE